MHPSSRIGGQANVWTGRNRPDQRWVCRMLVIFGVVLASVPGWGHPLKMSFSRLSVAPDGSVQMETNLFLDDLMEHLNKLYGMAEFDFSEVESSGTQALQRYLDDRLYVRDGETIVHFRILSVSRERLVLVVKAGTKQEVGSSSALYLVNTILCDASPKQTNEVQYGRERFVFSADVPALRIR